MSSTRNGVVPASWYAAARRCQLAGAPNHTPWSLWRIDMLLWPVLVHEWVAAACLAPIAITCALLDLHRPVGAVEFILRVLVAGVLCGSVQASRTRRVAFIRWWYWSGTWTGYANLDAGGFQ